MSPFKIQCITKMTLWARLKLAWEFVLHGRMSLICTLVDEKTL